MFSLEGARDATDYIKARFKKKAKEQAVVEMGVERDYQKEVARLQVFFDEADALDAPIGVQQSAVGACNVVRGRAADEAAHFLARLKAAPTNYERGELLSEYRKAEAQLSRRGGEIAGLTCAAVALIAETFSFSSRRREAFVLLHASLPASERAGFAAMLDRVLTFEFDRHEVLRGVA